jgi:hypothetical protein
MSPTNTAAPAHAQFQIRHRNPLARDYVVVSRVVLVGYPGVSDGAKLTYWVIYDFDWYQPDLGGRKGYAFPTIKRLAALRRTSDRTIQNHLSELIGAGLLTRELRPGKPSILYIEEPSGDEVRVYLGSRETHPGSEDFFGGGVQKSSPQKQHERKQDETVNGVQKKPREEQQGAMRERTMTSIGSILRNRSPQRSASQRRTDWLAEEMATAAADRPSLACYKLIARQCPEQLVFRAIALLNEARRDGTMLRSKGAFLVSTVRRLCQEAGLRDPVGSASGFGKQLGSGADRHASRSAQPRRAPPP